SCEGCYRGSTTTRCWRHAITRCADRVVAPARDAGPPLANSPSLSTCALARQERRFWALETARANGLAQQEPAVSEANCANKARQFGRCSLVSGTLRKRRTAWWAREKSQLCGPTTTYRKVRAIRLL